MAILDKKITAYTKRVAMLPIRPNADGGLDAEQVQAWFDQSAEEIRVAHNALIDALAAVAGAGDIGAVAPTGLTGATVQALIQSLKDYSDSVKAEAIALVQSAAIGQVPNYKTFVDDATLDGDVYTRSGLLREDNTLAEEFILSNKVNGQYLTKTYKSYAANGVTVLTTTVRTLTYKPNGAVVEV